MPDNEYKLPKLTTAEFEAALDKYLEWLKANNKTGFMGTTLNLKELRDYYSDLIASQGVGEWLPNYQDILSIGAPERLSYETNQQYQGKVEDWMVDVSKAQRQYYSDYLDWAKMQEGSRQWGVEQDFKERAFQWQQQEAKNAAQQQAWEQLNAADKARWTAQAESSRLETERMMNIFRNVEAERDEVERQKKEMDWDAMRNDILATVQGSPRNWIQTARASSMQNPYTKSPETFQQNLESLREDYKSVKEAAKNVRSRLNDSSDSLTWQSIDNPQTTEDQMAAITLQAEKNVTNKLNEMNVAMARAKGYVDASPQTEVSPDIQAEANEEAYWATPRGDENVGFTVGRPSTPVEIRTKVPEWLQKASGVGKFVPESGTRVPILTPSGQSWAGLSNTQQLMYKGLADVAGQRSWDDIEKQMLVQLPRNPSLGRSWKPAAQRV